MPVQVRDDPCVLTGINVKEARGNRPSPVLLPAERTTPGVNFLTVFTHIISEFYTCLKQTYKYVYYYLDVRDGRPINDCGSRPVLQGFYSHIMVSS